MTDLYLVVLIALCAVAGLVLWLYDVGACLLRRWHEREHERWRQADRPHADLERAAWREVPDMGSGPHRRIDL